MIRDLTLDDAPALAPLLRQVQALHARAVPDRYLAFDDETNCEAIQRDHLQMPGSFGLGYVIDGMIVGYLIARVTETAASAYHHPRRIVHLNEVVVGSPHRRKGIASALLEALKTRARDDGACAVQASHAAFNTPSAALLTRHGFDVVMVRREVAL